MSTLNIINETDDPVETGKILSEVAYEQLLPEMQSLNKDELLTINLDIPSAVVTVLGIQTELVALEHPIRNLIELDAERVLNVGVYARALMQAHSLYVMALQPSDRLKALTEEGTSLRQILISDAQGLALRGLMNAERLKELTGPVGYKNLAVDLHHLVNLFESHYPKIRGRWGSDKAEIERAKQIAISILEIVGYREQAAARVAEASDIRTRAFTLFIRTYDQARRAVTYLRWDMADVSEITPSLYINKGRRKDPVADDATAPTGPVAASPAGDHGAQPATDLTPAPVAITPAPVAPVPTPPAKPEIGTPNANPFLS